MPTIAPMNITAMVMITSSICRISPVRFCFF
jgi:hypothetical protein